MISLTEGEIRASFVNASKREVAQASAPELGDVAWERLDVFGWVDLKRPSMAYVVLELGAVATGVVLRPASSRGRRPRAMCAWCQDVNATDDVTFYGARRAAGRQGNTLATFICTDFRCSANVRRIPSIGEAGSDDPVARQIVVDRRVASLRERSRHFVGQVSAQG